MGGRPEAAYRMTEFAGYVAITPSMSTSERTFWTGITLGTRISASQISLYRDVVVCAVTTNLFCGIALRT